MEEKLLGKCGFYCGACPTYINGGCSGCEDERTTGDCFTRDCVKKEIDFCEACKSFPCNTIDKVMLRRKDTPHGEMLYSANGYVTAWFMWQLQGDEYAANAFTGDNAEIVQNELYQNQHISFDE